MDALAAKKMGGDSLTLRWRIKIRKAFDKLFRQRAVSNTVWLLAERVFRVLTLLVVTAWVARYFGPDDFGKFNYASALVLLIGVIANLGLESVVVRDIVRWPERRAEILASSLVLRLAAALVGAIVSLSIIAIARPDDPVMVLLVGILGLGLMPQAVEVLVYGYQADVNARPVVLIRCASLFLCSSLRISLLAIGCDLVVFASTFVIEPLLFGVLLLRRARRDGVRFAVKDASLVEGRRLVREGWPLVVAAASVAIYMRIDQLMLAQMQGDRAVGILSAAVKISEAWHALPVGLMASFSPGLVALFHGSGYLEFERAFLRLARLIVAIGVSFSVVLTLLSSRIVNFVYGESFSAAAGVLAIHVWGGVFVCLGLLGSGWMVTTGRARYIMWQTVVGAISNVFLNLWLIPVYGAVGAAIATVLSYGIAAFLSNAATSETRPLFFLQLRSLGIPTSLSYIR